MKFSEMFDDETILDYIYHCNAQRPRYKSVLAHCILIDSSIVICWTGPFVILGGSGLSLLFYF